MVKGIIFDFGGTLCQVNEAWDIIIQTGAQAMATWYLQKKRIKLNSEALIETFVAERAAAQQTAIETQTEILAMQVLRQTLIKIEAPPSTGPTVEAALKVFFEAEEAAWQPYSDAVETLKALKAQGYRLGLYSNATDDRLIQRLVNRNKLRPWLAPTFSSAGRGWRKPKAEVFTLIAERWNLPPTEIVVVGDTLQADILGARNAGMRGILATMNEALSNESQRHIEPEASINQLSALPDLVAQL